MLVRTSLSGRLQRTWRQVRPILSAIRRRLHSITYIVRSPIKVDETRYRYQQRFISHNFSPSSRVLDIGSGGDPFPSATVLADRYLEATPHRAGGIRTDGKPVVACDIHALPFADRSFDYVL